MFLQALSERLLQLLLLPLLVQAVLLDPVQLSLLLHDLRGLVLFVLIHGQVQGVQTIWEGEINISQREQNEQPIVSCFTGRGSLWSLDHSSLLGCTKISTCTSTDISIRKNLAATCID